MAIYTKRGDKGETSMYDADSSQRKRVSKSSDKVMALGAIDELNSFLGIIVSESQDEALNKRLKDVQRNLLTIGSILAGSGLHFSSVQTKKLEAIIDDLEGSLPVLKNFVLPGGSSISAKLQYARTLTRKAERAIVAVSKTQKIKPQVLTYLNRLSDTLFMLAREVNYKLGVKEEVWIGKKNK